MIAGEKGPKDHRPLYAAEGITKHFNNVVALESADFSVAAGEVVGLVGDNGAGKSTLVGILSGLTRPTQAASSSTIGRLAGLRRMTREAPASRPSTRIPASPRTSRSPPISSSAAKSLKKVFSAG